MNLSRTFRKSFCGGALALSALAPLAATAQVPISAHITADNSYRLGFGPPAGPVQLQNLVNNTSSAQILTCSSGPESYSISPLSSDYLYVVAYDDESGTQGLLGQFDSQGNAPSFTGAGWEVCAVGATPTNPPAATINSDIVRCNNADPALASRGWVGVVAGNFGKLKVGEPNDTAPAGGGNVLPQACTSGPAAIGAAAQWIWYDPNSASPNWPASAAPFQPAGGPDGEYLIFRLPVREIPGVCRRLEVQHQYAVKFACFQANEEPLALVSGVYGTAINVHSPHLLPPPNVRIKPIFMAKKVAIALPGERVGPVSDFHFQTLGPDQAFEIDCGEIRRMAGAPATFFTGFVVIDSDAELDVTAIYTGRPVAGQVSTMDVEIVPRRAVEGSIEICQ